MDWQSIAAITVATIAAVGGMYRAYREIERRAYAQAQLDITAQTADATIARKDRELAEKAALIAELKAEQQRLRGVVDRLTTRLETP